MRALSASSGFWPRLSAGSSGRRRPLNVDFAKRLAILDEGDGGERQRSQRSADDEQRTAGLFEAGTTGLLISHEGESPGGSWG